MKQTSNKKKAPTLGTAGYIFSPWADTNSFACSTAAEWPATYSSRSPSSLPPGELAQLSDDVVDVAGLAIVAAAIAVAVAASSALVVDMVVLMMKLECRGKCALCFLAQKKWGKKWSFSFFFSSFLLHFSTHSPSTQHKSTSN
jgi:hypothetical protein